ncbi:unnamed protein product [Polarella glacialis]|uniref:AP2/ERF domain-containing protein n=1 Tax=Polarella glacialis TaxID=89957 RepID=A0A813E154_POLGL|nr:unnamed protein product [Polarella glacialis]
MKALACSSSLPGRFESGRTKHMVSRLGESVGKSWQRFPRRAFALKGSLERQSRFRGVSWDSKIGQWRYSISEPITHRRVWLGYFDDELSAAAAYDVAAIVLCGSTAGRNLPDKHPANEEIAQMKQKVAVMKSRQQSSHFRGVHWDKSTRKWCAKLQKGGVSTHLGLFQSEPDAALAFDAALRGTRPCRSELLRSLNNRSMTIISLKLLGNRSLSLRVGPRAFWVSVGVAEQTNTLHNSDPNKSDCLQVKLKLLGPLTRPLF